MTRFGFKQILSHYKNSNDASLADDKSRSQKSDAQSGHTQDDSSCDNIEPKAAKVRTLPTQPPGETVNSNAKIRDLKPTVRTQFVLGRTMRNNDYSPAAMRRGSYMRRDQSRPSLPATRNRSRKPKPMRHLGGGVRLCPVCGQRTTDASMSADGQTCICDLCNAKIHTALENYNGQSGNCQSNYSAGAMDWRQSAQSGNQVQGQGQGQGQGQAGNPSEPPPFSIVVLQDCENSALIDQLTTALARTCIQQSSISNDYGNEYKNTYSSGYTDRGPPGPLPAYDYAQPVYNQNPPPPPTGQVFYDDTQNRVYDTPLGQSNYASQRNSEFPDNEPYIDNYSENNLSAEDPRNNDWVPDPGYSNIRPAQRSPPLGENSCAYNPSCSGVRRKTCSVNMDDNSYAAAPDRDDVSGFSGVCTCNCEFCRNNSENSGKLVSLIAQALEMFLSNNVRDPAANKERKSKQDGKDRKTLHSRSASSTGESVKSLNTRGSAQQDKKKDKKKEKSKEKSKTNGKEKAKGQPKDKNKNKHTPRQSNNSNFYLPDSEQPTCKCKQTCNTNCRNGCAKSTGRNGGPGGYSGGCTGSCSQGYERIGKCTTCCTSSRAAEHKATCAAGCQANCSGSMTSNNSAPSRSSQRQSGNSARSSGRSRGPSINQQSGGSGGAAVHAESAAGNGSQSGRLKQSTGGHDRPSVRSKSPACNAAKGCRCCVKQQDRFGAGDATNRMHCGCCAGFAGRRMNSQAARPTGNCIHGLQPVAHYRPGMLQFPINYTLRRNGECVRRSLVRTAAGATLHERPHSEEHISNALHDQGSSKQCSRCRSNLQFWH
ncbi:uncharacterized protein LOC135431629 isoform X2 [Drosophila montana]|uniref:uncharacterized protein LOC135431629 isoform X2 n=1 Tax=Drosophila montana TaxID=40370 RepID=UPI00313D47D4